MVEVCVSSWDELMHSLYEDSWRESLNRYRLPSVFRGMNDARHELTTGLTRLGRGARAPEEAILRAFRKYAYRAELSSYSVWNWLVLAQHHGLSTRLLDWTYSPPVALHFATDNSCQLDVDGVVWSVDYLKTNDLLPSKLRRLLDEEDSEVFTADMLSRATGSLAEFDGLHDKPFVAFFEPPPSTSALSTSTPCSRSSPILTSVWNAGWKTTRTFTAASLSRPDSSWRFETNSTRRT